MKKIITTLFISAMLQSCGSYLVDKKEVSQIPKGAKKIVINSNYSSDSLFTIISKSFIREGWIIKSNKSSMQISAESKSVGHGTTLTPVVYIEGGKAYYSGEWGMDYKGQLMIYSFGGPSQLKSEPIKFRRAPSTKNDLAFQGLLLLAKKVPNSKITYEL